MKYAEIVELFARIAAHIAVVGACSKFLMGG